MGDFEFDDQVANVFPDMIARSVPGYASILSMIEQLAARFIRPDTNAYDLGCSLGAASMLMARHDSSATVHAVDNAPAMVRRLRERLSAPGGQDAMPSQIMVHEADILDFPLSKASFIVLNLTLQFLPVEQRSGMLQSSFDAMVPGGALLLSEKIRFDEERSQELLTELHHDFKRAHGYSELEIAQKRTALENCMVTETLEAHMSRLRLVGFEVVVPWFQCFNFVSVLAIKAESTV